MTVGLHWEKPESGESRPPRQTLYYEMLHRHCQMLHRLVLHHQLPSAAQKEESH